MSGSPEFLTVKELADLLRIKERKVYDLASAGDVPCNRATGKLLFPEAEVRAWIECKQAGKAAVRPVVFLGSHDPLLEWALRQSQCGLATFFDGSSDGLARFWQSEGIATGLHIHDRKSDEWNVGTVAQSCADQDVVLIGWATRRRGLVVRSGEDELRSIGDLRGKRLAPRQPMSGTAVLLESILIDADVAKEDVVFTDPCHSEQDAVLAVAEGVADVTFGLEAVAGQFGLGFLPLVDERFDILVDRKAYFDEPIQTLLTFCRSEAFRERAATLSGYGLEDLGEVRWNA